MKFITDYKELGGESSNSILDHLMPKPMKQKEKILNYLNKGKEDGVRCSGIFDYVANEPKFDTIHLFTDGEYYWDSEEIYHFEKYNLILNNEFIEYVLNQ